MVLHIKPDPYWDTQQHASSPIPLGNLVSQTVALQSQLDKEHETYVKEVLWRCIQKDALTDSES